MAAFLDGARTVGGRRAALLVCFARSSFTGRRGLHGFPRLRRSHPRTPRALERELEEAREEIATLRGEIADEPSARRLVGTSWITGGPRRYRRSIEFAFELEERTCDAIAALARAKLGIRTTRMGRQQIAPGELALRRNDGHTRIVLGKDWPTAPRLVLGALGASAAVASAYWFTSPSWWMVALVIFAAALLSIPARRLLAERARAELAACDLVFDEMVALAKRDPNAASTSVAVRIAEDVEDVPDELGSSASSARSRARSRS